MDLIKNDVIPVVIPSYEPDKNLLSVIDGLVSEKIENIIVVDDGSGREYRHIFDEAEEQYKCTVLRHAVNLGKGRALKTAFNYILNKWPDVIGCITADSDGQHACEDIKRCMKTLAENQEDLILGCRDFNGADVPQKSRFGNRLTKRVCNFLCGVKVSDTQTGLRGIPREFMKSLLNVSGERFEFETNMLLECRDNAEITEVPIRTIYDSKEEHKTHFSPVLDSIRIYAIFGKILLKYMISSFSSSVIDLLLFTLFCEMLREKYQFYVIIATVLARIISATYNYLINYKLVFDSNKKISNSAVMYIVLVGIVMISSALLVNVLVHILHFIPEVVIKAVVDTLLFFFSYHIQQKYVF